MEIARKGRRNGSGVRNGRVDGQIPFLMAVTMKGHTTVY
jgi:hypothetical protein